MKITINKENWTGEKTTLTINKSKKTFRLDFLDAVFRLVQTSDFSWKVFGDQWDDEHPICNVYSYETDDYFVAYAGDYRREAKNPYIAAAQLLCNII